MLSQKNKASAESGSAEKEPLSPSLEETIGALRHKLGYSSDLIVRKLGGEGSDRRAAVCYLEGMVDQKLLAEAVKATGSMYREPPGTEMTETWLRERISAGNTESVSDLDDLVAVLLQGNAAIAVDGLQTALTAPVAGGERRAVEEPSSQTVIRGPKEGFTEDLTTNLALVRRKLRTPDLRVRLHTIGRYTKTKVVVAYIEGIADPEVVEEITDRLTAIDTDSILESGYIEEFIQDTPFTPFPTVMNTERPDAVAGALLDGQVAILIDGSPFVLIAPVTFFKFFQSSEDYYQRYDISTFLRFIRLMSFFIAMLLPSLYIAVTTFQQEMLPTTLLISLAAQREGTPFPALLEAFLMELTFEIIREAGVRMPRVIGPAISIVGALVLGQAAVQAGLVSGAMVIVVSFTAIANFVIPAFNMGAAVRLVRFMLMFLAGTLGLFGILAGLIPILVHLVSIRSFGTPYFMPVAPFRRSNQKDLVLRAPWWALKTRPEGIGSADNRVRQGPRQQPKKAMERNERQEPVFTKREEE